MSESARKQHALKRSSVHNTVLNLLGQAGPLLIGLVAIPLLIRKIGMDRYGLLSLIWMVVGYFALLDLGLGRAIIKLIAEKIGGNAEDEIPPIFWNAMAVMTAMTVMGSVAFSLCTPLLVRSVFKIPIELHDEAIRAFTTLSLSLIMVTVIAGYRGVLEAYHRFELANLLQALTGISNFLVPLAIAYFFTQDLFSIVLGILVSRFLLMVAHVVIVVRLYPYLRLPVRIDRQVLRRLFHFATWSTVSSLVGSLMIYADRFILGAIVPVGLLAFYTTPFEMMSRLLIIPTAVVRAVYPRLALLGVGKSSTVEGIFIRGIKGLVFVLLPVILCVVYGGEIGLQLWLGENFARESTLVLQLMAVGVLIHGIGHLPHTLLQSAERPDLPSKMQLVQLPFYLPLVWGMVMAWGINGAAAAWTIRVSVDTILAFVAARWILPGFWEELRRVLVPLLVVTALLLPAMFHLGWQLQVFFFFLSVACFAFLFWRVILLSEDRARVVGWIRSRASSATESR